MSLTRVYNSCTTANMRNFKTEGIIIKRRNVLEADRIITVFTREHGKLQIKARGVRRITSKRASHIELLNYAQLSLYKGSSLPILVEAQMIESFSDIKNDLNKIGFAYHICELIDGLCPENQEQHQVFDLLKLTLERLAKGEENSLIIIHEFEIDLLSFLGYWHKGKDSSLIDTQHFIEHILERKLKSHQIFSRLY